MSRKKPVWRAYRTRPELRRDWEPRFNAWLERAQEQPQEFGHHDCLIAVAGAIEAQTGRDYAEGHRGRYGSRAEARDYLKGLGFASPAALFDSILDKVPIAFAQRGDIVLADGTPGVVTGGEALIVHEGGNVWAPRTAWKKAWSVGRRTVGAQ